MTPKGRGLEGINFISYFNYPFCIREWISYVIFLGEARRFLIPHEILKPTPGLLGGWLMARSLLHLLMCSFSCSLIHSFHPYLSLIDPSSSASWLGKGK
jgi:hypothetical protein